MGKHILLVSDMLVLSCRSTTMEDIVSLPASSQWDTKSDLTPGSQVVGMLWGDVQELKKTPVQGPAHLQYVIQKTAGSNETAYVTGGSLKASEANTSLLIVQWPIASACH